MSAESCQSCKCKSMKECEPSISRCKIMEPETGTDNESGLPTSRHQLRHDTLPICRDIVLWSVNQVHEPKDKTTKLMRKLVSDIQKTYGRDLQDCISKTGHRSDTEGLSNHLTFAAHNLLGPVGQEQGGVCCRINWARIVSLFAFASMLAKDTDRNDTTKLNAIIHTLCTLICKHAGDWILLRGGWSAFLGYYESQATKPEQMYTFLICAAMAVLGTQAAFGWEWPDLSNIVPQNWVPKFWSS